MRLDHALATFPRQPAAWSAQHQGRHRAQALDPAQEAAVLSAHGADPSIALTEPCIRFLLLTAQIAWLALVAFLYLG